ncbi:thiamine pyrophosphokinase [Elusimicrobium simillimum]|uniref:thiamine diphosphokinase n=1 Tax=Elusimicrobium simillimum TaxID=3143438 RepID=UPI003C6EC855
MRKTLIICNGAKEPAAYLRELAQKHFVICVDGGANIAAASGVTPDIIVGDLDSVTAATKRKFAKVKMIKISRQDNTDFEKALDYAKKLKLKDITIVCATGKRLDFTLSNLYSSFKYLSKMKISFVGRGWAIYPTNKTTKFKCTPDKRVSLIPATDCSGITLVNLKFPLTNVTLGATQTLTLSNSTVKRSFEVKIKRGGLFVYLEK